MKLPIRCKFVTKADFGLEAALKSVGGSGEEGAETAPAEVEVKEAALAGSSEEAN